MTSVAVKKQSLRVNDDIEVSIDDGLVRLTGSMNVAFPLHAAEFHWTEGRASSMRGWGALTIVVGEEEPRTTVALDMSCDQAQQLHTFLELAAEPGSVH